jgi:hypothetical protein
MGSLVVFLVAICCYGRHRTGWGDIGGGREEALQEFIPEDLDFYQGGGGEAGEGGGCGGGALGRELDGQHRPVLGPEVEE